MLSGNEKNANNEENFLNLLKEAENGHSFLIMTFLSSFIFSQKAIDQAFRRCLKNFPSEKEDQDEYIKCFRSFIEHYKDFNYQSEEEGKQTILMQAATFGVKVAFDLIVIYTQELGFQINYRLSDINGENIIHKIVNSSKLSDEDKLIMIKKLIQLGLQINCENNKGLNALSMSLITGNSKLTEEMIKLGADLNSINNLTGDTMVHYAVYGKNPLCLQLLKEKNENIVFELKGKKNKNGESPIDLVAKMGLAKFMPLLGETNYSHNKQFSMIETLEEFRQGNYQEALRLLEEIQSTNEINFSVQWNALLVKYFQNDCDNIMTKISEFFTNLEKDHIRIPINNILLYNYALFQLKLGNYKSLIKSITEENTQLTKNSNQIDWILFINISFIFLQIFLELKQTKTANIILNALDGFISKEKKRENLKSNICDYLNSKEVINDINNLDEVYSVLYLFKAYKALVEYKSEDAKKFLNEYKRIASLNSNKIYPAIKNFYSFLKIKLEYNNNSFFKCYKHLNGIYNYSNSERSLEASLFYNNTLGIINLRHKKYYLAECFFKTAFFQVKQNVNKITKSNPEWIKYAANVRYNIGLSYFYQKRWTEAQSSFIAVKEMLSFSPFLHYRLGMCNLEMAMGLTKQESINYNNDLVNKFLGYNESQYKYMDSAENNNKSDLKKIILRSSTVHGGPYSILLNKYLHDAILHFKHCVCLIKNNQNFNKEIEDVYKFYSSYDTDNSNKSLNILYENKGFSTIITPCYLNLIFSLILLHEWSSVIHFSNEFEVSPYFTRELDYTIDNYKIEAYLALNQHNMIINILKKNMFNNNFSYLSVDFKGSFYNQGTKIVSPEINYKIALYINIIKMNFITNNLLEVEKGLLSILNLLNVTFNSNGIVHSDLPSYVLNLIIYYFLFKENYSSVINLIKHRRLPANFLSTNILMSQKNIR
jgi:hypothetical protein